MPFVRIGKELVSVTLYESGRVYMSGGFRSKLDRNKRVSIYIDKRIGEVAFQIADSGTHSLSAKNNLINCGKSIVNEMKPGRYVFSRMEDGMFVFEKEN
jgi:hypothetical protein